MRVQRISTAPIIGAAILLTACGGSDLTVEVLRDSPQGAVPQENIEVGFYPFDRDSVFDALDAQASSPKPEIPADMASTFEEIRSLQAQYNAKNNEWAEGRDRLQNLSRELQGLDRRSRDYMQKYEEFGDLETQVNRLEREKVDLFEQFTGLQESVAVRVDSFRIARDSWEEAAYADYFDLEQDILKASKAEVFFDTTGAAGTVTRSLPGGEWWVVARVPTPRGELYWNVKVDPGAIDTLRLNSDNGEDRVRL
ncbi:MAG: hypothetical protein P8049_00650 [Gemmatimonadota bacterium]|jgi:hypothetical protein